jgi:hypothetical protein
LWGTAIISALGSVRQEDLKFEASLGYFQDPVTNKSKTRVQIKLMSFNMKLNI